MAIAYTIFSGLQPRAWSGSFIAASNACLYIGGALILISALSGPFISRKPWNERAIELQQTGLAVGFDLLADSIALLMAIVSPLAGFLISTGAAAWLLLWSQTRFRRVTLSSSYVVQRTPEVVFAFVSDIRNESRCYPDVESAEMLTSGPIGPGAQFRERVRLPSGQEAVGLDEIVEYEPSRRFTTRSSGRRPNLAEYVFEPAGAGTRVTHRFDVELSFETAMLGVRFLQFAAARRLLVRRSAAEMRTKQILESSEFDR